MDIVLELKNASAIPGGLYDCAADEIIRLRAEREALRDILQGLPNKIIDHAFDYARLEHSLITYEIVRSVSAGLADALQNIGTEIHGQK